MKKPFQVLACTLLLICSMIVLSACGGGNSSGTNDSTNKNTTVSSGSTDGDAHPPSSAVTASASGTANGANMVHVIMGEMYFKPDLTTFKVGQPYQFLLTNVGKQPHEFTIAPPRKAGQTEKDEEAKALLDAADLLPGQTRAVDFTFKQPAPAGTWEIECSYPGHYEMGMHLSIVVEP